MKASKEVKKWLASLRKRHKRKNVPRFYIWDSLFSNRIVKSKTNYKRKERTKNEIGRTE